jgi:hypothetical protein
VVLPGLAWDLQKASLEPERCATRKIQSGINGLLPTLRAGPFHLFRLFLALRSAF